MSQQDASTENYWLAGGSKYAELCSELGVQPLYPNPCSSDPCLTETCLLMGGGALGLEECSRVGIYWVRARL